MALHAHRSPGRWTIGNMVVTVLRHSVNVSISQSINQSINKSCLLSSWTAGVRPGWSFVMKCKLTQNLYTYYFCHDVTRFFIVVIKNPHLVTSYNFKQETLHFPRTSAMSRWWTLIVAQSTFLPMNVVTETNFSYINRAAVTSLQCQRTQLEPGGANSLAQGNQVPGTVRAMSGRYSVSTAVVSVATFRRNAGNRHQNYTALQASVAATRDLKPHINGTYVLK
jgi:hypothetical protein